MLRVTFEIMTRPTRSTDYLREILRLTPPPRSKYVTRNIMYGRLLIISEGDALIFHQTAYEALFSGKQRSVCRVGQNRACSVTKSTEAEVDGNENVGVKFCRKKVPVPRVMYPTDALSVAMF